MASFLESLGKIKKRVIGGGSGSGRETPEMELARIQKEATHKAQEALHLFSNAELQKIVLVVHPKLPAWPDIKEKVNQPASKNHFEADLALPDLFSVGSDTAVIRYYRDTGGKSESEYFGYAILVKTELGIARFHVMNSFRREPLLASQQQPLSVKWAGIQGKEYRVKHDDSGSNDLNGDVVYDNFRIPGFLFEWWMAEQTRFGGSTRYEGSLAMFAEMGQMTSRIEALIGGTPESTPPQRAGHAVRDVMAGLPATG